MNIIDLPDDILVLLINSYLGLGDLLALAHTCTRFATLIDSFNLWAKYMRSCPLLDFSFPNGFNEHYYISKRSQEKFHNGYRLHKYLNLVEKNFHSKVVFNYAEKMIPHIQLDDESTNLFGYPTLFASEANRLCCLNVDELNKFCTANRSSRSAGRVVKKMKIFYNNDVRGFVKKSNFATCFSESSVILYKLGAANLSYDFKFVGGIQEIANSRINCIDFSTKINKLIYGSSDGTLKIRQITDFDRAKATIDNPFERIIVGDRILRCVIAPSLRSVAVGSAGIFALRDQGICPIRVYDLEKLREINVLKPASKEFKLGAGTLALSYVDENLVLSAGYDTFIRLFDLRTNKCAQSLEEPEDMSIYCVCTSKYYGLLSGNDRQSIIRYWDRRKNRIISTYFASNSNSSIYSLQCSPESIYAAWDYGITDINFS